MPAARPEAGWDRRTAVPGPGGGRGVAGVGGLWAPAAGTGAGEAWWLVPGPASASGESGVQTASPRPDARVSFSRTLLKERVGGGPPSRRSLPPRSCPEAPHAPKGPPGAPGGSRGPWGEQLAPLSLTDSPRSAHGVLGRGEPRLQGVAAVPDGPVPVGVPRGSLPQLVLC